MTGFKVGLVLSVSGLAILAPATTLVETGKDLGQLSAMSILGVIAVACIIAIVYLYKDKTKEQKEHTERLAQLITSSVDANRKTSEAIKANTGVMVEVKNAIMRCNHNK